jgi:dimethylaniline monooxygenase (N-oxide forming)
MLSQPNITAPVNHDRVAVIGAGPAGVVAAKHLLEAGFEPIVFEQSDDLGGQWQTRARSSGIWPGMRTNTSRTTTAFSDFPLPPSAAMFPRAETIHAYLHEYAEHFGVRDRVRTGTRVVRVGRAPEGWTVRWIEDAGQREEHFGRVVVASGRFRRPHFPAIEGLDALATQGCVRHSMNYAGREEFHGKRVLVYGNSISGLEIAADLAADDTITVTSACRQPRYVLQKVVGGLPTDWRWFNRLMALVSNALPPEQLAEAMRDRVLAETGDPARYGGLPVDPEAPPKLSQSQEYLSYLAEGRIVARPDVRSVEGRTVRFDDGSEIAVDELICATGYDVDLGYLSDDVRRTLRADDTHLDLHARTFHPDLPGLAFLGQYLLIGPYFPTVELQARWVATLWSGGVPAPSRERMLNSIIEHRAARERMPSDIYPMLAALLAGELGVEPDLASRPGLASGLLFGPLAPARYRLDGPGSLPQAEALLGAALEDFGPSPATPQQIATLRMVADALADPSLVQIAEQLAGPVEAA